MKPLLLLALLTLSYSITHLSAQSISKTGCVPCEQLKNLQLPDVTILEVRRYEKKGVDGEAISVPFCRVLGRISKEINFELLLPVRWNKRFLMSGGGGFVGSISNWLRGYVDSGYATAGTDAGHQGDGGTAEWALNNMERQLNFGKLAIHRTAVVSKAIINKFYCTDAAYAYFLGCSRGGGQAMMEAQQYPEDFDGFVAGAPAFSWAAIAGKFIKESQLNYPQPGNLSNHVISSDNLRLLQAEVLKQCDAMDGIVDSIINDPRDCKFDLSKLPVCPNGQVSANCFTPQQLAAIKAVYDALVVNEDTIAMGYPYGGEAEDGNWDAWIAGSHPDLHAPSMHYMFGTNIFKFLVFNDSTWNYSSYDFSHFFKDTRYASSFLDATETDYTEFKKIGRKMIIYHGWNDAALSAYETIKHYKLATEKDKDISSSIRLFLLPGVLHCVGGPGPDQTDWINLIRDWVERKQAPERVVVFKQVKKQKVMSRPVFPYPKVAVYSGSGDKNLEKNFVEKK